jgi:hypothetical protein
MLLPATLLTLAGCLSPHPTTHGQLPLAVSRLDATGAWLETLAERNDVS